MKTAWQFKTKLTINDHKVLQYFVMQELAYFNTLNSVMTNEIKTNTNAFFELSKKLRLIGEVVEHDFNVKQLLAENKIPKKLEPVKDDISMLSENAILLLEKFAIPAKISKRMKRNIGVQMFKFYASQADAFRPDGSLRFAPQFLENMDTVSKNHVQLHRKTLIIEEDNNKTLVKIPYLKNKLVFESNIKKLKWDIMILKPGNQLEWIADLRQTGFDYMLKYRNFVQEKSAFKQTQHDYKKVNF